MSQVRQTLKPEAGSETLPGYVAGRPRVALAGNPNCGKTTAFNAWTGARQHVGNYPGVTVERKEGVAHTHGQPVQLVDLPGTYSLTAYSMEEVVVRRELTENPPLAVIDHGGCFRSGTQPVSYGTAAGNGAAACSGAEYDG